MQQTGAESELRNPKKEKVDTDEEEIISPTAPFDFEEQSKQHLAAIQTLAPQNLNTPSKVFWSATKAFKIWIPTNKETKCKKKNKKKRTPEISMLTTTTAEKKCSKNNKDVHTFETSMPRKYKSVWVRGHYRGKAGDSC